MPNDPLARYHFTDDHGHPLENCVEYRELLAEVERLREEKEILEGTLDCLGIFVQENLNYCAADFIGEGIDEDAEFTCKTEYDPDNGCQKCYSNCWAEVFRKTAEEEIKALKELDKENAERP